MCLLSAGCPRAVAVQLLTLDYCTLNRVHGVMSTHKLPKITKLIGGLPCVVQMTQKILEAEGEGDSVQLDFFLKGNLALEKNSRRKPHSWLPDQVRQLYRLHLLNSLLFTVLSHCASTQASVLHSSQRSHSATLAASDLACGNVQSTGSLVIA